MTDIGGVCPNCGADDKWRITYQCKVEDSEYDYFYELECQGELHHDPETDDEVGSIEPCKYVRDITRCEEPEYEPEDEPGFLD